jgi:predicted 3-demethylubiquinone-9 3-methyltransferase (glyoxalase superfamily)
MARAVATLPMFDGVAEEAMTFYVSLFSGSEICFDSPVKHDFTFTPSISIFVDCENDAELDQAFTQLSKGGAVLMPLDNYGFSTRFGWVKDRFGVSWQLNLQ